MDDQNEQIRAKSDDVNLKPSDQADTMAALDGLLASQGELPPSEADGNTPDPDPEEVAAAEKAAADKAAADKAAEDAAAAEKAAAANPEAAKAATEKAAADKAAAEKAAADAKANEDPLDKITLPPHTKPKSAEAFELLKTTAKAAQAALRTELTAKLDEFTKLQAELAAERAKSQTALTPEITAELEDLRKFRLSKDVEFDPEFRKLDGAITGNLETIYAKLKAAGWPDENIAKVKEIGPANVDWDPIFAKLPAPTKRLIEATLVENERLIDQRAKALETAKSNVTGYNTERATREAKQLAETAGEYLKGVPWANERKAPVGATAEQVAAVEADNKRAREATATLQTYLKDRSPERFVEFAVGTLIAHRQKEDLAAAKASLEKAETDRKAEVAKLTAEVTKLTTELGKIKKAQIVPRPGDQITPVGGQTHKADLNLSGAEALDALAKAAEAAAREQ